MHDFYYNSNNFYEQINSPGSSLRWNLPLYSTGICCNLQVIDYLVDYYLIIIYLINFTLIFKGSEGGRISKFLDWAILWEIREIIGTWSPWSSTCSTGCWRQSPPWWCSCSSTGSALSSTSWSTPVALHCSMLWALKKTGKWQKNILSTEWEYFQKKQELKKIGLLWWQRIIRISGVSV